MVVAVKVFKKTSPNGKLTIYLGRRDFIDRLEECDPVDGIVVIEDDYLKGRKVYAQLVTTYRYGREDDEVMGVKFSKEMVLCREQVVPSKKAKMELTNVQEKLLKKIGSTAYPFTFRFPDMAPQSVTLMPGDDDTGKPIGVDYAIKVFVGDNEEDRSHKRSSVTLVIKKLQNAPASRTRRLPSSMVSKGFTFSNGKINLELTLDRDMYYHGEKIGANVVITNNSKKTVKSIKAYIVQHVEITMVNAQFSKYVASLETREGCPITPGASLTKVFYLVPSIHNNKGGEGVALDGFLKEDDVNLASSTLVPEGKCPAEALGIVVSYSVRVKVNCGTLGGELTTDVPFKMVHPAPGTIEKERAKALKKLKSIDRIKYENNCYVSDDEEKIIFEDFARLRLNEAD